MVNNYDIRINHINVVFSLSYHAFEIFRKFVLIRFPAAIFAPFNVTPTWRLHTKPYKFGKNVFSNISHMDYRTDLVLGEAFCIFNFSHFPDSGLSVLTAWFSCIFVFDGVTVKTQNSDLQPAGGRGGRGGDGGTSLKDADGDVPLDGVPFSQLG